MAAKYFPDIEEHEYAPVARIVPALPDTVVQFRVHVSRQMAEWTGASAVHHSVQKRIFLKEVEGWRANRGDCTYRDLARVDGHHQARWGRA